METAQVAMAVTAVVILLWKKSSNVETAQVAMAVTAVVILLKDNVGSKIVGSTFILYLNVGSKMVGSHIHTLS